MKILIISQNTFPVQGPRAFRTQELSEELVRQGHDVTLYTVHGDMDYSEYETQTGVKMRDIHPRLPISANDGKNRYTLWSRFLYHFLHSRLLYPEIELYFKVDSILQKEKDVNLLITIAWPHSIHAGAARSKRKHPQSFPKTWIADCGDPFFLNPFLECPEYFERFERDWCSKADYITIPIEAGKDGYFPEYQNKICIIPQGFNFNNTPIAEYKQNDIPTFGYAGSIYGKRDPKDFILYLSKVRTPFKFYLFTQSAANDKYRQLLGERLINVVGKTRAECIYELSKMDFLINFMNPKSIQSPSKLIDYAIAGRPAIDIDIPFSDSKVFEQFLQGEYSAQHRIDNIDDYRIENVAKQFVGLVNKESE